VPIPTGFRLQRGETLFYLAAMANYRRSVVPGGSFFFTVNLADRRSSLLTDEVEALRAAFRFVASRHPFSLDAVVILPEHLHCIWTLPAGDPDFATRWRLLKTEFSKEITAGERRSRSRAAKGERGIWQRRYWEHMLRDEQDFARHCDYIHFNPVKHGRVPRDSRLAVYVVQKICALGSISIGLGRRLCRR